MTNIFTYGSLMFDSVWQQLVTQNYTSEILTLPGFERRALKHASYPAAIPAAHKSIRGRLYHAVSDEDVLRLDNFEGDEYIRIRQPLPLTGSDEAQVQALELYLFKPELSHLLCDQDWDEAQFKDEHIGQFISGFSGFLRT